MGALCICCHGHDPVLLSAILFWRPGLLDLGDIVNVPHSLGFWSKWGESFRPRHEFRLQNEPRQRKSALEGKF